GGYARHADSVGPLGEDRPAVLNSVFPAAQRTASLRAEAEAVQALGINAVSDAGQLLPGCVFSLTRHADANGRYLLTEITHDASVPSPHEGDTVVLKYSNRFTCLPKDLPYRPARRTVGQILGQ